MIQPGDKVVLTGVPRHLVSGLSADDQDAIRAAIGTEVTFVGLRRYGEAEVEFTAASGTIHTIWVGVWLLRSKKEERA